MGKVRVTADFLVGGVHILAHRPPSPQLLTPWNHVLIYTL